MASVGVTLRNEREAQGRSIEDISVELCLMPTYLRAIEGDDVSSLPGVFFYKSFVRQYAGLLGVNPTLLQSDVDTLTTVAEPGAPSRQPSRARTARAGFRRSRCFAVRRHGPRHAWGTQHNHRRRS